MARAGIEPAELEDVLMGCALPEGANGLNIGRIAALAAHAPQVYMPMIDTAEAVQRHEVRQGGTVKASTNLYRPLMASVVPVRSGAAHGIGTRCCMGVRWDGTGETPT